MGIDCRTTICLAMAGDRLGGSHISLKGLLDRLPEEQFRVIVILEVPDGRLAEYFSDFLQIEDPGRMANPFAVGRKFGLGSFLKTIPKVRHRANLLRELGADIVHTNDGRSHAGWALATKLAGAKMVWHHRGDPDARGTSLIAPILADQIVGVSEYSLPPRRWGKLNDARVIHSPFDVDFRFEREEARSELVEELGCPEDTIICAYVGQFIRRKRPVGFIETIFEMEKLSDRPVKGVMFGEPKDPAVDAQMEQRLADYDGEPPVRMMGYRTPGQKWIAACDVLLVPALNEPLGRTLVEAMLAGTPVVAARSGGNPEALKPDCGIIVPPDDPRAMARATLELIGSPAECHEMTERAREMAERRFTSARHVQQVCEVYAELAGNRSRQPELAAS